MVIKKRKKRRQYSIDDLVAIAEQLGGRVRVELVPIEVIRPQLLDPPVPPTTPDAPERITKPGGRGK